MLDEIQSMVFTIPNGKPILALELILWQCTSRVLLEVLSLLGQRNSALVVNSQYWYYTKYNISEMTISYSFLQHLVCKFICHKKVIC